MIKLHDGLYDRAIDNTPRDYWYLNTSAGYVCNVGGNYNNSAGNAGPLYCNVNNSASNTNTNIGGRLVAA